MTESNKRQKTKQAIEDLYGTIASRTAFLQITTVKLAEIAGISRSSFYTHYKDKYDMIDHYQNNLFSALEDIFQKHAHNKQQSIFDIFKYLQFESLLAALLSENGTKEIQNFLRYKLLILLKTDFQNQSTEIPLNEAYLEYYRLYLANAAREVFSK